MTYYKALDGYHPTHGGHTRYPGVGRWTRHLDPDRLSACEYGFHLAKDEQIVSWLSPTIFIAEPCPDHPPIDDGDKWVTCRVRLLERTGWDARSARLFAADCAEAVLYLIPADRRASFVEAIAVARRFAVGEATDKELAAARDAAWAAARAAAGAAARAAAWPAAWAAAGDAAGAAARDAAQDAAGAAAGAAAQDAAGDAAGAAAGAAAQDAAWTAAREAQYELFKKAANVV